MLRYLYLSLIIFCMACAQEEKRIIISDEKQPFVLSDSMLRTLRVDSVREAAFIDELNLNGVVRFNQDKVARVVPAFGGLLTKINYEIGDYVQKGAVIAVVKSSEVAAYLKERTTAQENLLIAQRSLAAIQDMFASGMASERDVLQALADLSSAQAECKKMQEIFEIYNIKNDYYEITSPLSGFVVDRNVSPLMQIPNDRSESIFTICGLDDVWVIADIYQSDMDKVHEGDSVQIYTLSYADKNFYGVIDRVYRVLDEESKTMNVRVRLANKQYLLKPGMYAKVLVRSRASKRVLPYLSSQCVIFEHDKHYVLCVDSLQQVRIQEVQIFRELPERTYFTSGLQPGDRVIGENALLLYHHLRE